MLPADALAGLFSPAGRENPYPYYTALVEQKPVLFTDHFTLLTGYAACDAALRDPRLRVHDSAWMDRVLPDWRTSDALVTFRSSILLRNPPDHERARRLFRREFTARRVIALRPAMAELTDTLLDRLADLGAATDAVDFMDEFAFQLPVAVIGELLGVPAQDRVAFRQLAAELTAALDPFESLESLRAADDAAGQLRAYFTDLVTRRRADPKDDLISALAAAADGPDATITPEELVANLVILMVAGFETTTNLLGNGLRILLDRPRVAARLRDNPDLAPGYVEEILRFDSPGQITSRHCDEDIEIDGRTHPAGREVVVVLGAANHDPRRFAAPSRFDPDRTDNAPLSFGGGAHYCLGAALARAEGQIALPRLLRRFPEMAPAGEPVLRSRLTLRGYEHLPVRLGPAARLLTRKDCRNST